MKVLVTGGAGYVGAVLVPQLLKRGHKVNVIDLYLFGQNVFEEIADRRNLREFKGDIRDTRLLREALNGCEALIHLACISNDPSFELNPALGRSINYEAFEPLVKAAKDAGVKLFIYASSSSVYGVSDEPNVTEEHALAPLTDYSKYKMMCEPILLDAQTDNFSAVIVRPATVCGYSPRQRMDLSVNILTNHAVNNRKIRIFGGTQKRPNIHIQDMVDAYLMLLERDIKDIRGKIYNIGYENHSITAIAQRVKAVVSKHMPGDDITLETVPTNDNRSYHISSEKIAKELNFRPRHSLEDAVLDLIAAFKAGKLPDSMTDSRYFNIKRMQELNLS